MIFLERKRWAAIGLFATALALALVAGACGSDEPAPAPPAAESSPLPDLIITDATVEWTDPTNCNGSRLCLIVTVANTGTADATGLSDGCGTSSFGDPEPWAGYANGGTIAAGASTTFRSGYPNLAAHLPAQFTLFCEVDAIGNIAEIDESNNTYSVSLAL